MPYGLAALLAAVVLAVLHLMAAQMRFLDGVPRSWWLSIAGGVSVAYVFVHLLPEIGAAQEAIGDLPTGFMTSLEHHAYLLALVGLVVFYGLERRSRRSRSTRGAGASDTRTAWLSISFYAVYNAVIGYLLVHREETTTAALAVFAVAMGVHFVVNDHGLREHHGGIYHRYGRWLCAAAVLAGWVVGMITEISEAAIGLLIAFIAGGVVLNVMKEELPAERESRFGAFFAGATAYTAILLAL